MKSARMLPAGTFRHPNGGFMRSRLTSAVLGLGLLSSSLLAVAPAHAAQVCQTAPNGAPYCYDNGAGVGFGTGGSSGGDGTGGITTPGAVPAPPVNRDASISAAATRYSLGSPLGPVRAGLKDGGAYRQYQRGFVVWSPATGAQISRGAIRSAYAKLGFEKGRLGYPTTGEVTTPAGTYQQYQGGTIGWSSSGGAHALGGAIRTKWQATGGITGPLGAPVSDETTGLRAGGASQSFRGGAVVWSSFTGAQVSKGAIRTAWLKAGAQNGSLGYPTGGEFSTPHGSVRQSFQHGQITWTASTGATIIPGTPHAAG